MTTTGPETTPVRGSAHEAHPDPDLLPDGRPGICRRRRSEHCTRPYQAGPSVRFEGPAVSDLFMAGTKVVVAAPVAGSAHLAGRRLCPDRWGRCKTMPGMAGPGHCLSKCRSGGLSQVS